MPNIFRNHKILIIVVLLFPVSGYSQDADRRAVYNAGLDYIEGMYQADAARMKKSVHPEVIKQGFYWKGKNQVFSDRTQLSYEQILQIARDWNRDGWLPDDAPKDVTVLDVQDKIASIRVTAYWGVDYLLLSKMDDKWYIVQILFQNWPKYIAGEENK